MSTVRQSQVSQQVAPPSSPDNHKVQWNDQDFVDAFVEQANSHGVTISPDTALELAKDLRGKVKQSDDLEVAGLVKEIYDNLFPAHPENGSTKAALDMLTVISNRIAKYKKVLKKYADLLDDFDTNYNHDNAGNYSEDPISPEEETELKGGILNDIVIPFQDGVASEVNAAIRKCLTHMVPLQKEKNELEAYIGDNNDKFEELFKNRTNSRKDLIAFRKEKQIRQAKIVRALHILSKINILQSRLYQLDIANNYVNRKLEVMDQYRGLDGITRYFEKVLEPAIDGLKQIIMNVRKNIVLPQATEKTRLEREWILRHHNTPSYQTGNVGPSLDSLPLDKFKESPVYEEMVEKGYGDEQIEKGLYNLNSLPMTWRKGQAIYMLMDPPAEKTIHHDIPTMMNDAETQWGSDIITNQPFNIEKGKFDQQKDKMIKDTRPQAMSKERKLNEAANPKAHWSVLFNLSRNQNVDASGRTRAEKYIESLPENVRENPEIIAKAEEMDKADHLHDEEIISNALHNPNTPDWVLMKAAVTGYAEQTRKFAKAILKDKRGWVPKLVDGKKVKDPETNDYVWERIPNFVPITRASMTREAQLASSPVQTTVPQAGSSTQQSLKNQGTTIDNNIQVHQNQVQQLQVQKQNVNNQLAAIPPAAQATNTPATNSNTQAANAPATNAIPVDSTGQAPVDQFGAPIQPMASSISFRKQSSAFTPIAKDGWDSKKCTCGNEGTCSYCREFSREEIDEDNEATVNGEKRFAQFSPEENLFEDPTQPEEGDFVYDDASSSLSVNGEHFIGHFVEWDDVVRAIREYAHKHQFYPNVWQISDHGNAHLVQNFSY